MTAGRFAEREIQGFDDRGQSERITVWIERRTFARVKVQATQTSLAAPVVSNEEIQTYAPVASIGNRPVFLFTGLTARFNGEPQSAICAGIEPSPAVRIWI